MCHYLNPVPGDQCGRTSTKGWYGSGLVRSAHQVLGLPPETQSPPLRVGSARLQPFSPDVAEGPEEAGVVAGRSRPYAYVGRKAEGRAVSHQHSMFLEGCGDPEESPTRVRKKLHSEGMVGYARLAGCGSIPDEVVRGPLWIRANNP